MRLTVQIFVKLLCDPCKIMHHAKFWGSSLCYEANPNFIKPEMRWFCDSLMELQTIFSLKTIIFCKYNETLGPTYSFFKVKINLLLRQLVEV